MGSQGLAADAVLFGGEMDRRGLVRAPSAYMVPTRLAANNARVASEVCGVDASTVSGYKNSASKKFSQDPSFAADWDTGWKNAAKTVASFQQMKTSSPKDYDEQKSATCSDLQEQMKM
ncbi:hypothetical protein SAMN06265784_10957 [Paraburkholderia susongensis]|uniref:Uncharacterized protein n=2 Tax=Paraburkholderia susongensis TaxID=1515439 RepID=A0A1X7LT92_9BURK|nr:hypothetical protein SAMN06265784_10957 [Paraburkholderia susongensis]